MKVKIIELLVDVVGMLNAANPLFDCIFCTLKKSIYQSNQTDDAHSIYTHTLLIPSMLLPH